MDLKLKKQTNTHLESIAHLPEAGSMKMPWAVRVKKQVVTTREKLEGYNIIKAILREIIDINRVTYRDTLSYFVVQLDGTSHKTICRLYLDKKKYMVLLNPDKTLVRYKINNIDELYKFAYLVRPVVLKMEEQRN